LTDSLCFHVFMVGFKTHLHCIDIYDEDCIENEIGQFGTLKTVHWLEVSFLL